LLEHAREYGCDRVRVVRLHDGAAVGRVYDFGRRSVVWDRCEDRTLRCQIFVELGGGDVLVAFAGVRQ
jgi:hypothetical protein